MSDFKESLSLTHRFLNKRKATETNLKLIYSTCAITILWSGSFPMCIGLVLKNQFDIRL